MIPIKKYFTEADRKALYDILATKTQGKKQDKKQLLVHLIHHGNKHKFKSSLYGSDVVKDKLLGFFHGKCGYCEDFMGNEKIAHKPDWDWEIEHYRPKAKVFEDASHSGYYWLAYECTNFLIACSTCNGLRRKANKFPIEVGAIRLTDVHFVEKGNLKTEICSLFHPIFETEKPLLINPIVDKPKDFIEFFADGTICGKNQRGDESISIYGLNRKALIIRRKKIVDNIRDSMAREVKLIALTQDKTLKNKRIKEAVNHHLEKLRQEIKNPESTFIAFRCAILAHFDTFIVMNENSVGENPFIMPERKALLNVYLNMKNGQ